MDLRVKDIGEVRAFSVLVTAFAVIGTLGLQQVLMPAALSEATRFSSTIIAWSLATPLSFFVGLRMLDNYHLTLDLERAAMHDPLTGAATRARFYERVAEIGHIPASLLIVDIDNFKKFNDTNGHLAGDAALRQVAATLIGNCRSEDVVARFGGEEFVILLPGAAKDDGVRVAERLAARLRECRIEIADKRLSVTASFGVAEVSDPDHIDEAIAQADAALYKAKQAGRDTVRVA